MGRNLGPLNIKDSYEGLVQISGSNRDTLTDGSGSVITNLNVTSSFATTASFALNSGDNTLQEVLDVGNSATQSIFLDGNVSATTFFTTPSTGLLATTLALTGSNCQINVNGTTVTRYQSDDGFVSNFVMNLPFYSVNITNDITASNASFTSASIGHLQTITGSAVIIGDEYVLLNANTPTLRYSGLQVYDSGSGAKASFEWDGEQDIWIQVDESAQSSVMLTGDKGTKGAETFPTLNTLQKGNGDATLSDSSITDNGTLVTINANVSASGYISASEYYGDGSNLTGITTDTGSFLTTASYSDPLLTFTKGDSSTFDVTISSDPFPYTGSAIISGSLSVDGVLAITGSTAIEDSVLGSGSLIDNLGQEALPSNDAVKHIVNLTQAEYDALTPDANTLYAIEGDEILGDTTVSGSLIGEVNTISDSGGTTTLDCSVGNYFTLAMPAGGSTTLSPTNIQIGQTINIKITQNATPSTLAYDSVIEFPGGTAFTISTGGGECDVLTLVSFDGIYLNATGLANFS